MVLLLLWLISRIADVLRTYGTLSLHAQPKIPAGARFIGRMALVARDAEFK